MKNKIVAILMIAVSTLAVSCKSGGMSEETKTKMTTFEADWNTMKTNMTAWGTTMNAELGSMHNMMHEAMPMEEMKDGSSMDHSHKMDMNATDSLTIQCNMVMMSMDAIKKTYDEGNAKIMAETAEYEAWKKTMMESKDEEATKAGLDEWNTKLAAHNTEMSEWDMMLKETKANCDAVCAEMKKSM